MKKLCLKCLSALCALILPCALFAGCRTVEESENISDRAVYYFGEALKNYASGPVHSKIEAELKGSVRMEEQIIEKKCSLVIDCTRDLSGDPRIDATAVLLTNDGENGEEQKDYPLFTYRLENGVRTYTYENGEVRTVSAAADPIANAGLDNLSEQRVSSFYAVRSKKAVRVDLGFSTKIAATMKPLLSLLVQLMGEEFADGSFSNLQITSQIDPETNTFRTCTSTVTFRADQSFITYFLTVTETFS